MEINLYKVNQLVGMGAKGKLRSKTIFNPGDISSSLTLSGSNLIATRNSVTAPRWVSGRADKFKNSGIWYVEFTSLSESVGAGDTICGFSNTVFTLDDGTTQCYLDKDLTSIAYVTDGSIRNGNTVLATTAANWHLTTAAVVIDLDNDLFWGTSGGAAWNGNALANPSTGVGGIALPGGLTGSNLVCPAISIFTATSSISMNCGQSAFVGTIPAGVQPWG